MSLESYWTEASMARVMELFVIVNAGCGIAAFLLARGAIKKVKRQFGAEDQERREE